MEVSSRLEGSYSQALRIWIDRFREAQKHIRDLEDELEKVLEKLDRANAANERVEKLCDEWDGWTKGESPTTKRIREELRG